MRFEWNDHDSDIGYYECKLLDDDGNKLDYIIFTDYTNQWRQKNDRENGYKRPFSFEASYCRGYSVHKGFDEDNKCCEREGGGYQGECTHTVEDIKRWCEEYLAQKYIQRYEKMLAELDTAKRRSEWFKENGYGDIDLWDERKNEDERDL